jgi:signal transduction histidine kinase
MNGPVPPLDAHLSWPLPPLAPDDLDVVRILIVDDQPSNLEALEALLAPTGCQLVRAQSADQALLALLEHEFAAIILDIRMPGMGGLELAALIKERRRTRHIPLLFLTAHLIDERDMLLGYGTGAVDYLTKPVHADILRSKVAVFVDLFRKSREVTLANASLQREIAERQRVQDELRHINVDLEQRVRERTEALQRADRRKDEFLASLAHELRNPLAPIRSAVEVLQAPGLAEAEALHARAVIVRQVDQMTRLIDDLIDVSRITSDKLVLQLRRLDLAEVAAVAVETSSPVILERRHRLTVELPETPVMIDADPARLAQVLSNLLSNAAQYTPPGGDVRLIASLDQDQVRIAVRDNGIGIEPEMASRVFELFVQAPRARQQGTGGLGVGLTLARRLVEMLGGRLELRSEGVGRGSEFIVSLPLARPLADQGAQPDLSDPALTTKKRILVVDDNHDSAEMLAAMLTAWGQQARVAFDGLSALATGRDFRPHVVLLDIGMPTMDGYETARRLRAEAWGQEATLIAVTGWGQESDLQRTRDAGFEHHLLKPVAPRRLRMLIADGDTKPV